MSKQSKPNANNCLVFGHKPSQEQGEKQVQFYLKTKIQFTDLTT